jgi:hypothetical protein
MTKAAPKSPIKISSEDFRKKLKVKHLETRKRISDSFGGADSFLKSKGLEPGKIREHSTKMLGAGAVAGALLLTSPQSTMKSLPTPNEVLGSFASPDASIDAAGEKVSPKDVLSETLDSVLPVKPRPLSRNEEKLLEQVFENVLGVKTRATLEGEHLNTTYGYIGAEQHLKRYPGDRLSEHGEGEVLKSGIAPGLGAWGYFAKSKEDLTPELAKSEKWYAVVQTLYLPDWNTRQPFLKDWYRYRKILIVNTKSGNAVVASIADSGPAAWTGKQFGGSPEVMNYLGGPTFRKGPVLVFFVDDPENKVPLGPVEYNERVNTINGTN